MASSLNPFSYTQTVTGKAFCNRQQEQRDLLRYLKASQNVLLYSHRRHGKTSLIQQVFASLKNSRPRIDTMLVNLYGTLSERDFIEAVFKGIGQIESRTDRLIKLAGSFMKSIRYSYDPVTQSHTVFPDLGAAQIKPALDGLMKMLAGYSEKRRLVVAFDEFQEIAGYSQNSFEKQLRSHIQTHTNIGYLFSGSQTHLLQHMFNDYGRAFYHQAQSYPLDTIATPDFVAWAIDLFAEQGRTMPEAVVEDVVQRCEHHPMYIQQFLYHLWDEPGFDEAVVDGVEQQIIRRRHLEFINLWEPLTQNQKKALRLIALKQGHDLFAAASLQMVGLNRASQVTRAIEKLLDREIVVKNDRYHIQDILLKKWLISGL
ncbi:MAG: ATP-binding protein [Desulfosarcina sp.]|nr:ATP-binding protein [Desulfosarcina sp.]MBC2745083.1 ATP-binding protein [Desulfosarcina sp.]MBC2767990.1 ATP-binding protein [Desulfosarcina sp.]